MSEMFRLLPPHWLLEARRFASFLHWLLEAKRFASFLHWLLEAKRFASFTKTAIYILWKWKRDVSLPSPIGCWKRDVSLPSPNGCWKRDVSLPSPIGCWKRDVSLPSPIGCWKRDVSLPSSIGCWKRNVSLLSPKQQYIYCGRGSETFRFLPPLVVGSETFRFLPPLVVGSEMFRFLPLLVVGSETFRFFYPNSNTYILGVEARRFASFPHWLLEARRFASFAHWLLEARCFASFLYWLLEAKRFASFTQTTIHILWAWKRDVSLPSPIGCWKRDVSLPSPIGCWKRNVSLLLPKQRYIYCGRVSETFRFFSPLATEAERFASARTIMERTTRFQKHIMFEGILSHIMPSANCPLHSIIIMASFQKMSSELCFALIHYT